MTTKVFEQAQDFPDGFPNPNLELRKLMPELYVAITEQ